MIILKLNGSDYMENDKNANETSAIDKSMWAVNQNIKEIVFRIIDTSPCFYDYCQKYFGRKVSNIIRETNEQRLSSNKKLRRYHIYIVLFENDKYGIVLWDFISTHKKYAVYSNREKLDKLNKRLLSGTLISDTDIKE